MSRPWLTIGRRGVLATLLAALTVLPALAQVHAPLAPATIPTALSDAEFWKMIEDFSEPNGYFQSDNLVGNERPLQYVVPALKAMKRGGVYLGVAPDQNFTYIVALEPRIAFIVDIRRGNLLEHLMYKAIFELSPTRADFLSRLFSRKRPEGLAESTSVQALFEAYWPVEASETLFVENLKAIGDHLTVTHGFGLSAEDLTGLAGIYQMFFRYGPGLRYSFDVGGRNMPNYADMMTSIDLDGEPRSYLATEANYRSMKDFETRNLLVPIVGDFAGSKALKSVGEFIASRGATVTAFYTSNVEQYLFRNNVADKFYENVASLPLDDSSVFIRSASGRNVIDPMALFVKDFRAGHLKVYMDVTGRGALR